MEKQSIQKNRELIIREKIFDHFSTDLSRVLMAWKMKIGTKDDMDIPVYICPISFEIFDSTALANQLLTLEHVPPRSLGGKGIILTKKDVNSRDGRESDKPLLAHVQTRDFNQGKGSLPIIVSNEKYDVKGLKMHFSIDRAKRIFTILADNSQVGVLAEPGIFENWDGIELKVHGQMYTRPNTHAMLKTAYLLAFQRIGYSLILGPESLINPAYKKIASYLIDKDGSDVPIIVLKDVHAPILNGYLGLVVNPTSYRCLVVNFSLGIKNKDAYRYCVFLPHPYDDNLDCLRALKKVIESKQKLKLQVESLESHADYPESNVPALWYHYIWKRILSRRVHKT